MSPGTKIDIHIEEVEGWWVMQFSARRFWIMPWIKCSSRRTSEHECAEDALLVLDTVLDRSLPVGDPNDYGGAEWPFLEPRSRR